jgi:hypothetical protein
MSSHLSFESLPMSMTQIFLLTEFLRRLLFLESLASLAFLKVISKNGSMFIPKSRKNFSCNNLDLEFQIDPTHASF